MADTYIIESAEKPTRYWSGTRWMNRERAGIYSEEQYRRSNAGETYILPKCARWVKVEPKTEADKLDEATPLFTVSVLWRAA